MRTILLRLWDLLALCFTLSPISCALYYYKFIPNTSESYATLLVFVTLLFIVINVFMLRRCFLEIRNLKIYLILNYVAYGIFIVITVLAYIFCGEVPYAWLFNTLKLVSFSKVNLSTILSIAISHVIMLVVIPIAPADLYWILDDSKWGIRGDLDK